MKSHRALSLVLALSLIGTFAAPAAAQPRTETLTLDHAIEIALVQQPSVRVTKASIEAANARIQSAKVAQRPTVSLSASVAESSSRQTVSTTGATSGGFFSPTLSTGFAASANWRLYDFGQTAANIRAAEASADATAASPAPPTSTSAARSRSRSSRRSPGPGSSPSPTAP